MEITNKLIKTYGADVPIFLDEIKITMTGYSTPYIFRCIKEALTQNELIRFDESVYYIPTKTVFGKSSLNVYSVIEKKYIRDGKKAFGFYSGWTFLNAIGGTRQVPNIIEIVTNRETMKVRKTILGKQKLILRKPKCEITNDNEKVLQVLELANQFDFDEDSNKALLDYVKVNRITIKDLLMYAKYYPAKAIKNMRTILYELA